MARLTKVPVATGKANIPVTTPAGYSTKQNQRNTSRSIRGKRDKQADFNRGASHGDQVRGSGNMLLGINVNET